MSHLGVILGPSWGHVGAILDPCGPYLGNLDDILEPPKPIGRKKLASPKTLKNTMFFNDFYLSGASLAGSVAVSGRLVAIRTHLGRMEETM